MTRLGLAFFTVSTLCCCLLKKWPADKTIIYCVTTPLLDLEISKEGGTRLVAMETRTEAWFRRLKRLRTMWFEQRWCRPVFCRDVSCGSWMFCLLLEQLTSIFEKKKKKDLLPINLLSHFETKGENWFLTLFQGLVKHAGDSAPHVSR